MAQEAENLLGAHVDGNFVTLLWADAPGLQVQCDCVGGGGGVTVGGGRRGRGVDTYCDTHMDTHIDARIDTRVDAHVDTHIDSDYRPH